MTKTAVPGDPNPREAAESAGELGYRRFDCTGEDPASFYLTVRSELTAYGYGLAEKPEVLCLSKADVADKKSMADAADDLSEVSGRTPMPVSVATGEGVEAVHRRRSPAA